MQRAWQVRGCVISGEGLIEPPTHYGKPGGLNLQPDRRAGLDGRLYASLFWLIGGFAIWLLAKEMSMRYGGIIALAYFLFVHLL